LLESARSLLQISKLWQPKSYNSQFKHPPITDRKSRTPLDRRTPASSLRESIQVTSDKCGKTTSDMKVHNTANVVVLVVEVLVDGRFRNKGHGRRLLRIRIMDFGGMMEVVRGRRMRSNGE
jgi:hypothetical protein